LLPDSVPRTRGSRSGELQCEGVRSASPPLDIEEDTGIPFLHSTSLIEMVDDTIWQAFVFFNQIRVLDINGNVIREFDMDFKSMEMCK